MNTQTEHDLQEIIDRLNAMKNSIALVETQTIAMKTDIATIKKAMERIEIRQRGR